MEDRDWKRRRMAGGGERRSRRGCMTCKRRRKKCPEDFAVRPDGNVACTTCFQKGLACHAPAPIVGVNGGGGDGSISNLSNSPPSMTSMPPPTSTYSPSSILSAAASTAATTLTPASSYLGTPTQQRSLNIADAGRAAVQKYSTHAAQIAFPQHAAHPSMTAKDVALDSSWLDDFFKEFSSLSDPIYQDAVWLANGTSSSSDELASGTDAVPPSLNAPTTPSLLDSDASSHTASNAAVNSSSSLSTLNSGPVRATDYDRIVQSHELDLLLERYSSLYEQLWRAVFTVPQHDGGLTSAIMALSRSSKACRAAAVAICLSYHHIMQRDRAANRRSTLGLTHFLMGEGEDEAGGADGSGSVKKRDRLTTAASPSNVSDLDRAARSIEWPSTDEGVGVAYKWYQFAMDEYKRSGRTGSLEQRISTLLNLRWTIIALDGGNAGRVYMEEIRALISDISVTTGYMRHTVRQGTMLSLIMQSALAADIFDAASTRNQRCAVRVSPTTLTTPASSSTHGGSVGGAPPTPAGTVSTPLAEAALSSEVLRRDLQAGPMYTYEFTSCLSVEIIECIMLVSNLEADIHDGRLTSDVEKRTRGEEVMHAIQHCQFQKADLRGAACVRAMALHEMWRQSTLIFYYQRISRLGPLAAKVQHALNQILSLADMLSSSMKPKDVWDAWMLFFIAGSVAILPEQRAKCLRFMEGLGSEQALLDNIRILRLLWQRIDETGNTYDWLSIAEQNGLGVCFGF